MRSDDEPDNNLDLPLPTSPESDLVFLRLLVSEMAHHAGMVLDGEMADTKLELLNLGLDGKSVGEAERLATVIRRGEASQPHLRRLVEKAEAYFEMVRQRPS